MKKKKILLAFIATSVLFFGCKKEDDDDHDDDHNHPTTTCKIVKIVGDDTSLEEYNYDANDRIVRVIYTDSGATSAWAYDTVYYDGSGSNIMKIENISSGGMLNKTWTYTYAGTLIVQIKEDGDDGGTPYTKISTYTYSGGKLTGMTSTGDPDGENMGFSNITYSGGNATQLDLDVDGTGTNILKLAATYDAKANADAKKLPREDMFGYLNANNVLKVSTREAGTFGGFPLPAGTTLFDNSYTYTTDNQVSVATYIPTLFDQEGGSETYTWFCETK